MRSVHPYTTVRVVSQLTTIYIQHLVVIEEEFERLLLDYDRVFAAMGIPACLWRRTGEIFKGNREFAELVGVSEYMLRDVSSIGQAFSTKRFRLYDTD
jgi:PAS domain-containing protein